MTREEMAARIRELRLSAGISQADAARHAGVNRATWQRYENAERQPRSERLDTIARALDIPLGAIYDQTVVADIRLSDDTRSQIARNPQAALTLAADLAARIAPALLAACTATAAKPRTTQAGDRLSAVGVAERLVRAKREGLRIAEWQHAQAVRAQTVE